MKGTLIVKYYSISEMSMLLGISEKSILNKITKLELKKSKSVNRFSLYTSKDLEILRGDRRLNNLKHEQTYEQLVYERSQRPVVITYHIYESKMNE